MPANDLSIYDFPIKPVADASRTPALIGREVDTIMRRTKDMITISSIAIGYRLIEAKRMEGHGGWLPWLAARGINERTARRSMELASHHEHLSAKAPEALPGFVAKSLRKALDMVHEEKQAADVKPRKQVAAAAPSPASHDELDAIGQRVLLGDEPIDLADLAPAARRQVQRALDAEPAEDDPDATLETPAHLSPREGILWSIGYDIDLALKDGWSEQAIITQVLQHLPGRWLFQQGQAAPEPEAAPEASPEPVAAPEAPEADLGPMEGLRTAVKDKLDLQYGSWQGRGILRAAAPKIGIALPSLKTFLEGGRAPRGKTVKALLKYVG